MRALITKGGAASPDNAADGLADEEKKLTCMSPNIVDKDLRKHANGKPHNVKNVTWGANTVQEFHTVRNGTLLQDDVDMRTEDAGDAEEVQKDTNSSTSKHPVTKREM